jgi:hypothetical protein
MQSYRNLDVWKVAHELTLRLYRALRRSRSRRRTSHQSDPARGEFHWREYC